MNQCANTDEMEQLLENNVNRWLEMVDVIAGIGGRVREYAGDAAYRDYWYSLEECERSLRSATESIVARPTKLEIVIALCGTPASNASAVGNMLVGESVFPRYVYESRHCRVSVRHDSKSKELEIPYSADAGWDCGYWGFGEAGTVVTRPFVSENGNTTVGLESTNPTKSRACDLLTRQIQSTIVEYCGDGRGVHERHPFASPPSFSVAWPTRMGNHAGNFGIPANSSLKFVRVCTPERGDPPVSAETLESIGRKPLCILVYDTDPANLDSVVDQFVRDIDNLRCTPERTIVIFDNIHRYLSHNSPFLGEFLFTKTFMDALPEKLTNADVEHFDGTVSITAIPTSLELGVAAVQAEKYVTEGDTKSFNALARSILSEYRSVVNCDGPVSFPRPNVKWSDGDRWSFIDLMRQRSRLDGFESCVSEHIRRNLHDLLVSGFDQSIFDHAAKLLDGHNALTLGYYDESQLNTHSTVALLRGGILQEIDFHREALRIVQQTARGAIARVADIEAALDRDANPDENYYPSDGGSPTARILDCLRTEIQSAIDESIRSPIKRLNTHVLKLMQGKVSTAPVDCPEMTRLREAIRQLRASPYGKIAKTGGLLAGNDSLRAIVAIKNFLFALSRVAPKIINNACHDEADALREQFRLVYYHFVLGVEQRYGDVIKIARIPTIRDMFSAQCQLPPAPAPRLSMNVETPPQRMTANIRRSGQSPRGVVDESWWTKAWAKVFAKALEVTDPPKRRVGRPCKGSEPPPPSPEANEIAVPGIEKLIDVYYDSAEFKEVQFAFGAWVFESRMVFHEAESAQSIEGLEKLRCAIDAKLLVLNSPVSALSKIQEQLVADIKKARETITELRDSLHRSPPKPGVSPLDIQSPEAK